MSRLVAQEPCESNTWKPFSLREHIWPPGQLWKKQKRDSKCPRELSCSEMLVMQRQCDYSNYFTSVTYEMQEVISMK